MSNLEESQLKSKKRTELVELCRQRKLAVSGTKDELVARILGRPKPVKKVAKVDKPAAALENKPVFSFVRKTCPSIVITRNSMGNFEHKETGFVFDRETKRVIGKQTDSGVINLKISDMERCHENGFRVDESRVDKEFSTDKSDRLEELLKYMKDEESGCDNDSEIDEE